MIKIGLVGYGYWGPILARNFSSTKDVLLAVVCESDPARREVAARNHPQARVTADYDDMLAEPGLSAVVVAAPVGAHFDLGMRALAAGLDVFMEKPLARTVAEGEQLVAEAEKLGRVLAVDHTFLFTGAVRKIKQLVDSGELGELLYFDSVRTNLGKFQNDVNVVYDLAPHDLSIALHLIGADPVSVRAMGRSHALPGLENIAYVHLEFPGDVIAHFHVNWLAPLKIRRTLIVGAERMIVYDDMEPTEKVKVYDKGVSTDADGDNAIRIDYRSGDMWAPKISPREALAAAAEHFAACVRREATPIASGRDGLRVLAVLEATKLSLEQGGARIEPKL